MNDNSAFDDSISSRPGWRYALWFGWNFLALAWAGVGIVVGAAAHFILSLWINGSPLYGSVAVAVGLSVVVADLVCRSRDAELPGWRRYASPFAGGAAVFIPAWLIGIGIVATGVAAAPGLLPDNPVR